MQTLHTPLIEFLVLAICAGLFNRLRGGGAGLGSAVNETVEWLPGRPIFYAAALFGLLSALYANDAYTGVIVAAGYLFWGVFAWGEQHDIGRLPPGQGSSGRDKTLADLVTYRMEPSVFSDALGMFVRELYVLPFVAAMVWYTGMPWQMAVYVSVAYSSLALFLRSVCMWVLPVSEKYRGMCAEIAIGAFAWAPLITFFRFGAVLTYPVPG